MRLINNLLLCVILLCTTEAAIALQGDHESAPASKPGFVDGTTGLEPFQNGGMTLSQAVEQVRRQYDGQIVSAETKVSGNTETHIIKVLTQDGTVKTVRVPGRRLN
ncbi:MAG: hypothetical protein O3A13_07450 [Proteobacteria bacterium]|nr:hypothetical protein [Pseudomonadota bacterium]MDA0993455.1 hypothetical protein [Pseudomonadota bacterium]